MGKIGRLRRMMDQQKQRDNGGSLPSGMPVPTGAVDGLKVLAHIEATFMLQDQGKITVSVTGFSSNLGQAMIQMQQIQGAVINHFIQSAQQHRVDDNLTIQVPLIQPVTTPLVDAQGKPLA